MPLPDYLRFLCDTSDSAIGRIAFDYCKSLCRIASVRVVSMTGGLDGPWVGYEQLTITEMVGNYINCVCVHPSSWLQRITIQPPTHVWHDTDGEYSTNPGKDQEPVTGEVELRTAGVRNVLFLGHFGGSKVQCDAAMRYDAIVCASVADATWWQNNRGERRPMIVTAPPGAGHHAAIRAAVLGERQ